MKKVLVTGATGQIGSELTLALRQSLRFSSVIAAGYSQKDNIEATEASTDIAFDIRDRATLNKVVPKYHIDTIFHLASLLSAVAEERPQEAWDINMTGLFNVLEVARLNQCAVFFPSSIGAFGPKTPATPRKILFKGLLCMV